MRAATVRRGVTLLLLATAPGAVLPQSNLIERSARAILEANCLTCHGAARMSDLDLRERESILKGGKRGPAVVPGKAEESLLYRAVRRKGDLQMPSGKAALRSSEIEVLRQWINGGVRWDSTARTAEPSWWAFRKPVRPPVPAAKKTGWVRNPIDAFILAKIEQDGLQPTAPADLRTLVRRAYFDLHGLPPTPEDVEKIVSNPAEDAYEKLIDGLLASPRYGERWGRYWLDVVRYADTAGFETDHFFPNAWRYRDYVIASFNADKPYHIFVQEQIAADELWLDNVELEGTYELSKKKQENLNRRIGTGLYTLASYPVEVTFVGEQHRAEWQADAVEVTSAAFLGLTMGCARCHDHKFDPISQRDYYRVAALFTGSEEREIPLTSQLGMYDFTRYYPKLALADQIKEKIRSLGRGRRRNADGGEEQRPAAESSTPAARDERETLLRQLGQAYLQAPARYPSAQVLAHSEVVPDTYILKRGDFKQKGEKVEPGFPAAFNPGPAIEEPKGGILFVPQRRKALAQWITAPDQPLLGRVMVNRIWQGHFGQGIVRTPNDFGRQGEAPTHPELLDWLAVEFAERGWSIKQMHRLIMLSNTYRLSTTSNAEIFKKDPQNRYLWRMNRRRLEAEALRDTVLAVAGTLNLKMGGMGVLPPITKEEIEAVRDPSLWAVHPDPAEHNRRSVYLQVKRALTLPMFEIFDAPDTATSCPKRESSTVAPQALALMNSEFMTAQAEHFAARLRKQHGEVPEAWVDQGWRLALGRPPSAEERQKALEFVQRNSLPRLCLLWFNMSEFLYVD